MSRETFYDVKGKLSQKIQEKLEKLAVEDVLERYREDTPSKRRKGINIEREKVPEAIE